MKKTFLVAAILLVSIFTVNLSAQGATTANTVVKSYTTVFDGDAEIITGVNFHITFAQDSLLSQLTPVLNVPEYQGVDPTKYPVSFRLKAVGTHGIPNSSIFLEGLFGSTSDTVAIDSIRNHATGQGETDTTGTLTLNNVKPLSNAYKVFIRTTTADIHSGTLDLTFPIPVEGRIRRDKKGSRSSTL